MIIYKKRSEVITIRVPEDFKNNLQEVAAYNSVSMTDIIIISVEKYMNEIGGKKNEKS